MAHFESESGVELFSRYNSRIQNGAGWPSQILARSPISPLDHASFVVKTHLYFANCLEWPEDVAGGDAISVIARTILVFGVVDVFFVRNECRYNIHWTTYPTRAQRVVRPDFKGACTCECFRHGLDSFSPRHSFAPC